MAAFEITISDTVDTMTIDYPAPPLTEAIIEGATDVTTLDMNLYTDFFAQKRVWEDTLDFMTETDFNQLKGFYDRQFTLWLYPTITISDLSVSDVVVRMELTPRRVIDNCGTVENVRFSFRETVQMTVDFGSS